MHGKYYQCGVLYILLFAWLVGNASETASQVPAEGTGWIGSLSFWIILATGISGVAGFVFLLREGRSLLARKRRYSWLVRPRSLKNKMMAVWLSIKPGKILDLTEIRNVITDIDFKHQEVTEEEIARDLNGLLRREHHEFGDDFCCGIHFDVIDFACVRKSRPRNTRTKIELELTDEYRGRNVKKLFYLNRGGTWSGLLSTIGERENIDCEVIPIDEGKISEFRCNRGENIIIVDLLVKGDCFLYDVINHFENEVKANIVDVVCLFNVSNPLKKNSITKSLITLDLEIKPKESCPLCGLVYRQDYYQ